MLAPGVRYPKPDRSDQKRNLTRNADGDLDIGWAEGVLSDGRPFVVELWSWGGHTFLTYFLSRLGLENATDDHFREMLVQEGLLTFKLLKHPDVAARHWQDPSGNQMWSVNVVVGDEDSSAFVKDHVPLHRYPRPSTNDEVPR